MTDEKNDLKRIEELIEIMKKEGLVEVEIRHGDDKIVLRRGESRQQTAPAPVGGAADVSAGGGGQAPEAAGGPAGAERNMDLVEIRAPIVGTFYARPSPDSEPYVEPGCHVEHQTVVCIVQAMKVMNEIKAETRGTIVEILVSDGQAVEYGQGLFKVRPDYGVDA